MTDVRPVRRALVAVFDKDGVVELARELSALGVELVSSGGTAATIAAAGIDVTPVETVTGFPEMLDGRVKTLHPKIHAGILADRRKPEHEAQLADQGIEPFDLVVVNLYPFRETVASGATEDDVIEKIDIGGPAMVRAAAKNFASVGVVVSPSRYAEIVDAIGAEGGLSLELRRELAAEAFAHTAAYDAAVAGWFASDDAALPAFVGLAFEKVTDLRYGENPHQRGALYRGLGWARRAGRRGGARRGQGDVVQQLAGRRRRVHARGRPRTPRAGGGDREAQQPLRRGRPGFARGVVRGGVRVRHGERVRGDRGVRTRGGRGRGTGDGRRVHRGRGRAVVHRRRARGVRGTQGAARGPSPAARTRRPRRAGAARGRARPGRGRGTRERQPSWRSCRRGNPPRTNGATCGSRGSSRCA